MNVFCKKLLLSAVLVVTTLFRLNAQITLDFSSGEIRTVLQEIERTSDYRFFFGDIPELQKTVSIKVKDETIDQVLDRLFVDTGIKYIISANCQIVLHLSDGDAAETESRDVGGIISDPSGKPLFGVYVTLKNSRESIHTVSNPDGTYSFHDADRNGTLIFSCLGFSRKEIPIRGRSVINAALIESSDILEDVVIIGYGSLEKRELTSSVTSLKSKDFIEGTVASPLLSISGKVTGLDIYSSAASDPNTSISLQLRGVNSILADQGPVIVIDGIPGGNLNVLQKEDIVSIDVLKDASAAAIYGTRASGGVILVTTRMGGAGRVRVNYCFDLTCESILKKAEMLSAKDWRRMGYDDYGENTDWFGAITRTPFSQRHMVTMSGGTRSFNTYASLFYKRAQGMSLGSDRQEVGARFNFSYKTLEDRLELSGRVSYVDIQSNFTNSKIFQAALSLNPTVPIYNDEDPSGYNILSGNDVFNPVAYINLSENTAHNDRIQTSFSARYNILDGWTTTLTAGLKQDFDSSGYWESALHRNSRDNDRQGYARQTWSRDGSTSIEWITNYDHRFDRHLMKAVAGYSFQQNGMSLSFSGDNSDFSNDGSKWYNMGDGKYLAEGRAGMSSYKSPRERLIAVFSRIKYTFDDRYLLMASVRYEGSSKFGYNNKWGLFPSVSAAWRISSESFMNGLTWINDLRIRGGIGITGNQGFDPGVTTRMYQSDSHYYYDGKWVTVYGLMKNVNYDLKWEKKKEINIGLDFDILGHRLSGKFDLYERYITDLIYDVDVSQPPAVYPTTIMNVGGLQNNGWEAEITGIPVKGPKVEYTSTLRLAHNRSKLLALWGTNTYFDSFTFPSPGSPGTGARLTPGEDIGQFYIWKYAGIDSNGDWLLYDKDDNVITASYKTMEDKRYIGNAIPKITISWDNKVSWKNLDLVLFFRSWIGHQIFNMTEMYYGLPNVVNSNVLKSAFFKNAHITGEKELCDYFLEDGSFLKLDAATLGYTFNIRNVIESLRVAFTARNLFCLTKYSGIDPETNPTGLTPGFEGLDMYPRTRVYTLGAQIHF